MRKIVIFPLFIFALCYGKTIAENSSCLKEMKESGHQIENLITNFRYCSTIFDDSNNKHKIFALPKIVGRYVPMNEARDLCAKSNGSLPSIESERVQLFLQDFLIPHKENPVRYTYWTSGRVVNGRLEWINNKNAHYANWGTGQPIKSENDTCVAIVGDGEWRNRECDTFDGSVVCEFSLI